MARILFVVFNHTKIYTHTGTFLTVATISSLVKQHGHETHLVVVNAGDHGPKKVRDLVAHLRPDVVGFSVMSGDYPRAVKIARDLKRHVGVKVIFGGIHVIIDPEEVLAERAVDYICVGEGEHPTLELLDHIDRGEPLTEIDNIWYFDRDAGRIVRNPLRPLNDLDSLPPPDASLFYHRFEQKTYFTMASVGCPHNCSYCFNHLVKQRYKGLGKLVRRKSVGKVIDEIASVTLEYPIDRVFFLDDTFALDRRWVLDFCREYARRVELPFFAMTHVNTIDEEVATALHRAGCGRLWFGIETGNEVIRREVLRRRTSNLEMASKISTVRKAGIEAAGFFMIGLPGEDKSTLNETYNLAKDLHLDCLRVQMTMPYKRTQLWEICRERGLLKEDSVAGTTHTPRSNLAFPKEHLRLLRKYYHKLYGLNTYRKYEFLKRHRTLIPAYELAKLFVSDVHIERAYHVLGRWMKRARSIMSRLTPAGR